MAKKECAAVIPLKEYVSQMEAKAQPMTVCQVTHPEAKGGDVYTGVYAGIRLVRGDAVGAVLSSGEVI